MQDSNENKELLDSIRSPSRASNNLLISTTLADISPDDRLLILAQNSGAPKQVSAVKHDDTSLSDGLIAHYAFGPDNWTVDRIAGQNIITRGEIGNQQDGGVIGRCVRLKRNGIQYAPIPWNGSDLPRAVNFWYWNADNIRRDTYFISVGSSETEPGYTLFSRGKNGGEIVLSFAGSEKVWPEPDFLGKPTMVTLVVPNRGAKLDDVELYVNGELDRDGQTSDNRSFVTSDSYPHLCSTSTSLNVSGQRHMFDELSFWNRTLSSAEIRTLYNEGNSLAFLPPLARARGDVYSLREWGWPWMVDTKMHREELFEVWNSLKDLDIGNGVPRLADRSFAGEAERKIYVDPIRGNDLFGSGSFTRPFKTLNRAVNAIPTNAASQLTRSTLIELASGVYELDDRIDVNSWGSPVNWLAIRGPKDGGPRPIVTYSSQAVERALDERDRGGRGGMFELVKLQGQYIEFSGIVFDQRRDEVPYGDQIHEGAFRFFAHANQIASNGVGCRILDVEIRNFLHAGIKGNAKGLIIDGVFIHDGGNTFHDHCVYISSEGEGSAYELRRSLLMNVTGAASNQHKVSDGNDLPAPEGATITHNVMIGNEHLGISTTGTAGEIAHNAIGYSRWYGVHFYRSSASLTRIQNNIFFGYSDPDLPDIAWSSYNLSGAMTKDPAGVVVEGNYFERGPTSDSRANPKDPGPWKSGTTYYTSNTVERNGAFYLCEVINNSKQISTEGPTGTNPDSPSLDGNNIRWWFLTKTPNRVENNLLNGDNSNGRNFRNAEVGDFHLRKGGEANGIGVDIGYTNGRNPGPWPNPVP
ncbi:MAG: hypothetical protein R3F07_04425 [Opitutaceae bacterium]